MIEHLMIKNDAEDSCTAIRPGPVMQPWTWELTWMQQSVLMTAIRGPDGIRKNHISKRLCRWLRRCILYSAFDRKILDKPYDLGERNGGSFTGASIQATQTIDKVLFYFEGQTSADWFDTWQRAMHAVLDDYMRCTDEMPHHFQLHFLHAAEIIGYCHPDRDISDWWKECYYRLCRDMHLFPEMIDQMHTRLGDSEKDWKASEEVTAEP